MTEPTKRQWIVWTEVADGDSTGQTYDTRAEAEAQVAAGNGDWISGPVALSYATGNGGSEMSVDLDHQHRLDVQLGRIAVALERIADALEAAEQGETFEEFMSRPKTTGSELGSTEAR